jgi:hypothetical protein
MKMTKVTLKDCETKYNKLCRQLELIAFSGGDNEHHNFSALEKIELVINECSKKNEMQ